MPLTAGKGQRAEQGKTGKCRTRAGIMGQEGSRQRSIRVDAIQTLMHHQNISKAELVRRARMSVKQVRNILAKRNNPTEDTLTRIASVLGVKWRTLLGEHDGPPEQASEDGGMAVKTTTDVIIRMSDTISPEEARQRLIQRLTDRQIRSSDIIRITILRDDDEDQTHLNS